ncbi:hypothetical protein MNBD_ALPHA01-2120 [hydrothermal vent metagenome]|uniref:Multidrug resistance protein MdtA-like alpha-helical hairpin domain-containing protein n=1 Tax=hydrothermal vent metagenome TaxID=652676 RepID=A0A3B0RDU5_9ZZZZ
MTDISDNKNMVKDTSVAVPFYRRKFFQFALGAVVVIAVTGVIFFTRSSALASLNEEQERMAHALSVETITIQAVNHYQVTQKYSGSIMASRESDHGFDRGGLLAEVLVDEGDQVKKGEILARLDMRRLDARERELKAELAQAVALHRETVARLDQAQATYDRYHILVDKKNISRQKYDDIKFDLIALKSRKTANEAAIERSKAALESLETDRDLAILTARFDGSVTRRYLDEGTALGSGTPVLRLIEDQKLEIQVGLPQSAIAGLITGDTYMFIFQGREVATRLRTILKNVDQSTRTVTAIFDVVNDNGIIRAGGLAQLSITKNIKQTGFWLPGGALAESRRGLWSAYSLKPYGNSSEYGTLSRQELQLLYTDGNRVFVRGTLENGNRIVSAGIHRLVPGQLVRISEAR